VLYRISLARYSCLAPFVAFLFLLSGCSTEQPPTSVLIYGGAKGGAYDKLIQQFDKRSSMLKSTKIRNQFGVEIECAEYSEGCPLLSKFRFESLCEGGGSESNLKRLGIEGERRDSNRSCYPTLTESDSPILKKRRNAYNELSADARINDFALVQNFYVAGAAQTYCPFNRNRFGPDALYFFEFTYSAPFIQSIVKFDSEINLFGIEIPWWRQLNAECDKFFDEQMDGFYKKFKDLRIVLPLYNGLVQFVSVKNKKSVGTEEASITTFDSLSSKYSKIYMNGVNKNYGTEALERDPRFLRENRYKDDVLIDVKDWEKEVNSDAISKWEFDAERIVDINSIDNLITDPEMLPIVKNGSVPNLNNMLACGVIGAYVISGDTIDEDDFSITEGPEECVGEYTLQQIQIPEVIIDAMAADHPYYQKLPPPSYWDEPKITSMPGLVTYLVTTSDADPELVKEVTKALSEEWDSLMLMNPQLTAIHDNILKQPAAFHRGAEQALLELEILGGGFRRSTIAFFFGLWVLTKILSQYSRSRMAYNRLGEKQREGLGYLAWHEALDLISLVLVWLVLFMGAITLIRNWDAAVSITQNTDDQLSALSFTGTLLWMFNFIASGYEGDVFPSSNGSQIIVSLFALGGVAYPLFLIAKTWDQIRINRQNRARGGEYRGLWGMLRDWLLEKNKNSYRSKGTLLLCGWNDRAPGLVYTLTCPDSPYEGMVNIVANMQAEYPIEFYGFNKKRVRFYRGDASHRSQLERAEADRTQSAVILSEYSSGFEKNNAGVLTALAIERFKSEIKVFAEIAADENDRDFMEQHIDNIVDPRLISRQVLTIGCFDNYVLDFVLDALSPDDHSEWYSIKLKDFNKVLPDKKKTITVAELAGVIKSYGMSVVGVCPNSDELNNTVFAPRFDANFQLDPLRSIESLDRELKLDDYIVCAGKDPSSFKFGYKTRRRAGSYSTANFSSSSQAIMSPLRSSVSVLIIGHEDQATGVADHIKETIARIAVNTATVRTGIVATDSIDDTALDAAINEKLIEQQWSHILLLSSIPVSHSQEEHTRLAIRADSDTILRASFIRTSLKKKAIAFPYIVVEVNRTHSRQLAKDAEIDTVVPSSLLIERMLARLVSGGGKVSELLSAMLSMKDDVYLRSTKLHEGHPLIGQRFSVVLNTWYKDGRVLGILPKSISHDIAAEHKNASDDFDWHFIMCPADIKKDRQFDEGDVLIILACAKSDNF
jgi:hypothetical protein